MLETYNKEKIHEYAKELFALCLEKGCFLSYNPDAADISVYIMNNKSLEDIGYCYMSENLYSYSDRVTCMTISELIEKVKRL